MPSPRHPAPPRSAPVPNAARTAAGCAPLTDRELDQLQTLLDRVPAPLEALDVAMLDGYLCGVLLQPRRVPVSRWLPHVTDVDSRPLPAAFDASRLNALVLRRHAELDAAIERRDWFDPWVFELEADPGEADAIVDDDEDAHLEHDPEGGAPGAVDAVYPWVAGFATALELFADLMALDAQALTEPLALVYRHLAPDDLEDADDLIAEIESLEPPADLADAVEGLVRATLLLADVSRPVASSSAQGPSRRGGSAPTARRR